MPNARLRTRCSGWLGMTAALLLLVSGVPQNAAHGQSESAPESEAVDETRLGLGEIGSQLFFDAAQTSFNRDMNRQLFDGEVVAIGGGTIIAADHIALDRGSEVLEAKGHVVVLSRGVVFIGSAVIFEIKSGDFRIAEAIMVAADRDKVSEVQSTVLGLTPKEVDFESERTKRISELATAKEKLRLEARRQARAGRPLDPDIVDRFARLLEREELIRSQENPSLARLAEERRERFKRRRAFWDRSKGSALLPQGALAATYFRIEGEALSRTRGNDFAAEEALFTSCRCDDDEAPAWGFRADRIDAQLGGYADLSHPVLEIKGIPVLYLPHLKIPLKDQRQSGFLMPTFAFERRAGNIFSQPVYFDLGRSSDLTMTTDMFENRGTRIGLEYRIEQRRYSGWTLELEGMRDRLWMKDRGLREDLSGLYRSGIDVAAAKAQQGDFTPYVPIESDSQREVLRKQIEDPNYWRDLNGGAFDGSEATKSSLLSGVDRNLATPSTTWRGSYAWRGVSFLAPRLSLVSHAEITSDHRYKEELYVPDDFEQAFFGGRQARAFSSASTAMHLDGRDFYLGAGTIYGDNFLLDERFQGQQLPIRLKLQSRKVSLLPQGSPVPIYAQLTSEQYRISEFKPPAELGRGELTLGDGFWQRIKFDTVSPLTTGRIVQVSHFSEIEGRFIEHAELPGHRSRMRSWTTGLDFSLPIDGKGELPEAFQDTDDPAHDDGPQPTNFAHHLMDWRLRFSVRPPVVKRGAYTDPFGPLGEEGGRLAYFASDRFTGSSIDGDVPEEERMHPHQRVALVTDHVWKLFKRSLTPKSKGTADKKAGSSSAVEEPADRRERARLSLLKSIEESHDDDLYDAANKRWLVDQYTRADSYYATPLNLSATIAYDFRDARERERVRARNRETEGALPPLPLPEAWKDPTLSLGARHAGFELTASAKYDVYARLNESMSLSLAFPRALETNISIGYSLSKEITLLPEVSFKNSHERRLNLATNLIPSVTGLIRVNRRDKDGEEPSYTNRFQTAFGIAYASPSECWGLQLSREKEYAKHEREASYLLRLSVVFMGQQRPMPNMSPGLTRKIRVDEEKS